MAAIFGPAKHAQPPTTVKEDLLKNGPAPPPAETSEHGPADELAATDERMVVAEPGDAFTSEETAVLEFNAIPLYFPMSYSLVKPYVKGFETNPLDAPALRDISIDNNWQPRAGR
jgi:hypothetical protein